MNIKGKRESYLRLIESKNFQNYVCGISLPTNIIVLITINIFSVYINSNYIFSIVPSIKRLLDLKISSDDIIVGLFFMAVTFVVSSVLLCFLWLLNGIHEFGNKYLILISIFTGILTAFRNKSFNLNDHFFSLTIGILLLYICSNLVIRKSLKKILNGNGCKIGRFIVERLGELHFMEWT